MNGQPVWLASVARRDYKTGNILPNSAWTTWQKDDSITLLRQALFGVGDLNRDRLFRMNITYCLHRALTDEEVSRLPERFHTCPASHLAGGPIEILWENVAGGLSTKPCAKPVKQYVGHTHPDLWVPFDCGECPSCLARMGIEEVLVK